jgi:hypothetical protein
LLYPDPFFQQRCAAEIVTKKAAPAKTITLTKQQLQDKIRGGWAGQTIGVTFGGPYEFRFQGTFINDYQPLAWYDGYLKKRCSKTRPCTTTCTWTSRL